MAEKMDIERLHSESGYSCPIAQTSGSTELTMEEAAHVISVGTAV